jgi:hypothetical protein
MLASSRVRPALRSAVSGLAPAVLLIAIALWEIVATVRAPAGVPDQDAWRRAAAAVRAQRGTRDLIVFAPRWIDPVGRLHLGDLISLDDAARMDAARYRVIWELSIRGARAPETAGMEPAWTGAFGGVTVRKFEQTPAAVVADLVKLAPRAKVKAVLAEVGFEPHRCIQLVPPAGGSTSAQFGKVPLGTKLVGYVGLADVFTRRDVRDPGRLEVRIDGQSAMSITVGVDDGWERFEIPTVPGEHTVEVIATAVGKKARDRRVCFAAEARR